MLYRRARIILGTLSTVSIALSALGQESVRKPDTLAIPLDFEINGQSVGDITIEADRSMQSVAIDTAGLKSRIEPYASPEIESILSSLPNDFLSIEDLQATGLQIALDLERLVITLSLEAKRVQTSSERKYIRLGYQDSVSRNTRHTKEARLSGYANFSTRIAQSTNELGQVRDSMKVGIDHALNFGGYALEGDSSWNQDKRGRESRFTLNRIRLVKDMPERLQRIVFGDLSTPIKDPQRGFQLWGLSIAKEFDIQPYKTFTPTSSASFQLDEGAVVQMNLNGRHVRSLKLEPGNYDIEQFKLAAGLNTMDLEIVTESGTTERIQVNSYGEPTLLNKGLSTYALSLEFPYASGNEDSFTLVKSPWYQRDLNRNPIISGYYQKGIAEQVTANINLQSSESWTRIGSQATWATTFGVFNANLGLNSLWGAGETDLKAKLDWRRDFRGVRFVLSGYQATRGFEKTRADSLTLQTAIKNSLSLRIAKRVGQKGSADLGVLQQTRHDGLAEQSLSLNFGYKFPDLHTGLSIRKTNRRSERGYSAYVTFTWNPRERWRTRTRVGLSSNPLDNGVSSNIDYSNRNLRNAVNANLNLRSTQSGKEIDGRVHFESERLSTTLSHSLLYQNLTEYSSKGSETALSTEFAVAFADGAWGLTRRVSDSFAIVTNHKAWRNIELGINPTLGGFEQRSSSGIFKPILTDLRSYRESQAVIRPTGGQSFLEQEEFFFLPSYKRGSKLTIGNEFVYSLRSTLLYWNEQPASYKTIKIIGEDMPEILTFTNRTGKFVATGLKPGTYQLTVNGIAETASFTIDGDEKLVFQEKLLLSDPNNN